ncbi:MAG: hypothetical protein WCL14_04185 [Bacteroidota bacterium]
MSDYKSDFIFNRNQKAVYLGTDPATHPLFLIPTPAHDALSEPKGEWELKYAAGGKIVKTTRSEIATEQKDAARLAYEPLMSAYVASYVKNNPKIPVDDKIAMYVHIDNHSHVKTVKPTSTPVVFKTNTNVSLTVELFYKDSEALTGHAKPHKEDVCQMYIFIVELDKDGHEILPVSRSEYIFADDSSDYHISLEFELIHVGKKVLILPRWKNSEGAGSFGKEVILTIPS